MSKQQRAASCLLGIALVCILACPISLPGDELRTRRESPIVQAYQQIKPSVVNIHGRKFERSATGQSRHVNGMGTGIVIDDKGYILTNFHVVDGVSEIKITFSDDSTVIAKLINHDPKTDLAILKISTKRNLPVARIGRSHDLLPGEDVIAVGNAYGYTHTVTRGIISALHRFVQVNDQQSYHDLIQTDASINPGNSGGPLLNINGDMIGINVAVRVGAQGIGFALPIDQAIEIAGNLLEHEINKYVTHGMVVSTDFRADGPKLIVERVISQSPSALAGVRAGDRIVSCNHVSVVRRLDFQRSLLGKRKGDEIALVVHRDGNDREIQFALAKAGQSTFESSAERAWRVFGLQLASSTSDQAPTLKRHGYRGGLRVLAVRQGGLAQQSGINRGDVLVGLHKWEVVSFEDLAYIMNNGEYQKSSYPKFYIVRSGELLFGRMGKKK
jgi:serine protease Do